MTDFVSCSRRTKAVIEINVIRVIEEIEVKVIRPYIIESIETASL